MGRQEFATNGKRDIHLMEYEYDISYDRLETRERWNFDENRVIVIEYIKACKKGQAKSGGKNYRVGKSSLYRVLGLMRMLSETWLKKNFDQATGDDWQDFYDKMEDDKHLSIYGRKYKQAAKAKVYKTVRKFLKWRYGGNRNYPEFCLDWVTTEEKVTKEYLTRQEVERMIQSATTLKTKCMIMMLFDGGFRIEELANLRWCDVRKEEGKQHYRAEVRAETSKTKKSRRVSLWLATDYIDTYKNSLLAEKQFNDSTFMFESNYGILYQIVKRLGKRTLNKDISPHTLRHSSATYYASIVKTYQQFCARYGWALRSNAPQVYFHAVADDEIAEQSKEHEIARFKTDFEKEKLQNKLLREKLDNMRTEQEGLRNQIMQDVLKELMQTKLREEIFKPLKSRH